MDYFTNSKDWKWLFDNAIDWDSIIPLYYPNFPTEDGINSKEEAIDFIRELLCSLSDWAKDSIAVRARRLDEEGAGKVENGTTIPSEALSELYSEARELGYPAMCTDPKYGGMGVPHIGVLLAFIGINKACISSATQLGFFTSIIDMLERFCDEEDKERLIPQIVDCQISGSMCLTEADAGSDLGNLKTSAEKQADGTYLLNGAKIFITNGGGGIGFVLARIKGAPEGLDGISLFLTEQYIGEGENRKQNYTISKSEHKMGLHGSFTCEVVYENTVAKLIGEENKGFRYMLHLMNEARLGVGLQSLGGMEAVIGYAREYAETRKQFQKPIAELPLYKRNLQDWETEVDAFRALMADTVSYFDIYQKLDLKERHEELSDDEKKTLAYAKKWVRRRTPLVKAYGAETYTHLSQRAIQALGGYGYMKEYDAERFHRDSFAPLLYEGTTQIQALMALKDLMKYVMKNPGNFFQSMVFSHPAGSIFESGGKYMREFRGLQYEFKKSFSGLLIKTLKPDVGPLEFAKLFNAKNWLTEESFNNLMAHAETLCMAMAYLETLRVLALHAQKDEERADLFYRYKKLVTPRLLAIYSDWKQ